MSRIFLFSQLVAILIFVVGCSITVLQKPDINLPKPSSARVLILGEFTSDQPGWKPLEPYFRKEIVEYLVDHNAFESVLDSAEHKSDALMLTGTVREVAEGSAAARTLISFGAGKATLKGQFELRDASGNTLLRFESHGAEYGGGGLLFGVAGMAGSIGGQERLIKGFAVNVANTVMRWSKGKKLH
jgi:hypothetical protein